MPNLLSLATYCVGLEPRSLPSTGITRLPQYCGPLRHPKVPGPSLAGLQLVILTTPRGFPCCVRFPGVHALATTPARRLGVLSAHFPSRVSLPRYGRRVGPRIVLFEACSAFTHVRACTLAPSPYIVTRLPEASTVSLPPQLLRLLPAGAFRRVGFSPTGKRRLFTAHAKMRQSQPLPGCQIAVIEFGKFRRQQVTATRHSRVLTYVSRRIQYGHAHGNDRGLS